MSSPLTGMFPSGINVYSPKVTDQAVSRKFVSQWGSGYLALGVYNPSTGNYVDPLANTISLKVWYNSTLEEFPEEDPRGELIVSVDDHTGNDIILKENTGQFYYNIGPQQTQKRGVLVAEWTYTTVENKTFQFVDYLEILDQMPTYDRLSLQDKRIVEQASWLFADMFDSTSGGPWLQENFHTHFNYERMAQLLSQALMKINVLGFPATSYGIDPESAKIPANWGPIVVWALKLEIIRHLMRSYTEIPDFRGMNVTYTDRRDYVQRWKTILDEEKPDFEKAVTMAKRSLLGLGRGSLLVAGGIYGGSSGLYWNGLGIFTAQARSIRFYPSAPAVDWGNMAR